MIVEEPVPEGPYGAEGIRRTRLPMRDSPAAHALGRTRVKEAV